MQAVNLEFKTLVREQTCDSEGFPSLVIPGVFYIVFGSRAAAVRPLALAAPGC